MSPGRFALQVTLAEGTHEKLRYAQSLLGHAVPSGDLAQVLDRALGALVEKLEKQKFGAGSRTRTSGRRNPDSRHIPLAVRRVVCERDGGRCTFVSDSGHRCEATSRLEFDHIQPFARGGEPTPSQLRLRCRAHNQYDAEQTYGAEFMRFKLEEAKRCAAEKRAKAEAREAEEARKAQERAQEAERKARIDEILPGSPRSGRAASGRGRRRRSRSRWTVRRSRRVSAVRCRRSGRRARGPTRPTADC